MKRKILIMLTFLLIPLASLLSACSLFGEEYTLTAELSEKGTYTLSHSTAKEGEDITITTDAEAGYKFDYALVNSKKITTTEFDMPDENATIKVYFTPITYYIEYVKDNTMYFSSVQDNSFTVEDEITNLGYLNKNGYRFEGWYADSELLTPVNKIEKGTIGNITLYPKFTLETYTITYHIDAQTSNSNNPTTYTISTTPYELFNPIKDGYEFRGWYNNENFTGDKVTEIKAETFGNVNLYPKFTTNKRDDNGFRLIETQVDFEVLFIEEFDLEEKYKLCTDIDMSTKVWRPVDFWGEFDGGNHSILNINIKLSRFSTPTNIGMFSQLNGATVKNLKVSYNIDVDLDSNSSVIYYGVGGIAGAVSTYTSVNQISNVEVLTGSKIKANSQTGLVVGGIIGLANDKTTIEGCSVKNLSIEVGNAVDITDVGGISGRYGKLAQCSVSLENTDFIVSNTAQVSGATINLAGIMGQGDASKIKNCYFSQIGTSKLKAHQTGSNTENSIAGIVADASISTTIDCCYAQIREFEFSKTSLTKNSKINMAGLACAGSISNCFVARARQSGYSPDTYNFNTTQDGEYYTFYNDPNNTYKIAYICFSQEVPNTYVEYADFFHNEVLLTTSKINDYHRIYNNDLLNHTIAAINDLLSETWDTTYWYYFNENYPPILK